MKIEKRGGEVVVVGRSCRCRQRTETRNPKPETRNTTVRLRLPTCLANREIRQLNYQSLWGLPPRFRNDTASAALHFVFGSDTLMAVGIRYSVRGVRNGRK